MADQSYGGWQDWLLCVCIAAAFTAGAIMQGFVERIRQLSASLSTLRKAVGVLSLLAIPYMVSVGFGEQAASVMNPQAPILWFTAAALNAVIFFWICEELITTKPPLRALFLIILGVLVILALRHQVNWVMAAADDAAKKIEVEGARTGKNETIAFRNHAMTLKLYSAFTTPSAKPPEIPNCKPEIAKPKEKQLAPTESPIQLSARFYNPQSPDIVVSNLSDRVAEGVAWYMVAFRTSDFSYFGFATQSIGYVKAHSDSAYYVLDLPTIQKSSDGNGRIADGDELTGSISIDCPQCQVQTYIVHFVWGHSGWFFESPQKAGYIVPKDMSKDGRAKYIQLFTSGNFAKDRIEIGPKPPS